MPGQVQHRSNSASENRMGAALERVLVVDDERSTRDGLTELISSWGYSIRSAVNGKAGLEEALRFNPGIIITDLAMPEMTGQELLDALSKRKLLDHCVVIVLSARGTIESAVEMIKNGAYDFLTKPVNVSYLRLLLERASSRNRVHDEVRSLRSKMRLMGRFKNLNGTTAAMKSVFEQIELAAPSTAPILISGESGTGKELVAKAVFELSRRKDRPYIAVNCAAIPKSLLESELFGHEKGSFTGAVASKEGFFEMADGGTLFLDEIGEMPLDLQTKLLRVLELGTFRRVGGAEEKKVDVRIIAATNKNYEEAVEEGAFREDLYYRLNVFRIQLPPLRERLEDIPLLVQTFVEEFNLKNAKEIQGVTKETMALLKRYSWPGNVRELKNIIERAVIVCRANLISPDDLPEGIKQKAAKTPQFSIPLGTTLDEAEKQLLFSTIDFVGGNKTRAAKVLNISLKTLHNKLNLYRSSV